MSDAERSQPEPAPPRRRFQFGLGTMLLAALPISILSAAWAGMMGFGAGSSRFPRPFFVFLAAGAPIGLMILVSVCRGAIRLLDRGRRRR